MLGGSGDQERQKSTPRAFLRSVSWSDRSPNKPNPTYPRAQPGTRNRSCLPPLSISRRCVEEWPKAGSDDLGIWPQQPSTPGGLGSKPIGSSTLEAPIREFESNKDRLAFYEKKCSRVADHIYLGSELVARTWDILRQNGITHVLNCVGFVCPEHFKGELIYKTLWLHDSPSEDITSILYDVFDYFEDVREQNGRVFVHCCQGVSRSASLVIAYLMWRKGQSFEDAFQYVKAARGVTNPNMGFACQLLQCQKRVHAMPASPSSVLRMFRMAPHSPYDPLHLVPKMLTFPGENCLDSRGAFVIHVPSAIYVWIGKYCSSVMSNNARVASQQVVKYERAQAPILTMNEGEEPSEFWDNLSKAEIVADRVEGTKVSSVGNRKISDYDLDFEIFHKAFAGGVVPPFTSSGSTSETCLPSREIGWGRLRRKFSIGVMKEFLSTNTQPIEEEPVPPTAHLLQQSTPKSSSSTYAVLDNEASIPSTSPCSSPESLSPYAETTPAINSKSPSLSPSTSDYNSLFTFSPSSSNWSESSNPSSQPSPSRLEFYDQASVQSDSLLPKELLGSCMEAFPAIDGWKSSKIICPSFKGTSSIAERRGGNPPTLMLLHTPEPIRAPRTFSRSWSFSVTDLVDHETMSKIPEELKHEELAEFSGDEQMSDADT